MNKSKKVNSLMVNNVINVKWKWPGSAAGKAMGTYVVAAFPFNNFARLFHNPFAEGSGQAI
jgi:hypothetical protein